MHLLGCLRPNPEQHRRAKGTQTEKRHRRDIPVDGYAFTADDVETEDGVGREARQVSEYPLIHLI